MPDTAGNSSIGADIASPCSTRKPPWFICPLPATVLLPATNGCDAVMPNLIDSVFSRRLFRLFGGTDTSPGAHW